MGGEGSGRYGRSGTKRTIEEVPALDVRAWAREGLLVEGQWFSATMTGRGGGHSVTVQVEDDSVQILRQFEAPPGRAPIGFRVQLDRTYPRFGGVRYWFLCPRPDCNRRMALLYPAGREFACRRCLNLTYPSQSENRRWRALRQAQKIRVRLGASANVMTPFPLRPRGMHVRTYMSQLRRMFEAEQMFWSSSSGQRGGRRPTAA